MPDLRLVLVLTCSCMGLFLLFGWLFILRRSPIALFLLFLRQYMSRDKSKVDRPIVVPEKGHHFRDVILPQQDYNFDQALRGQGGAPSVTDVVVQSAAGTPDTLDVPLMPVVPGVSSPETPTPYPRPLTPEEEDSVRPFRTMSADFNHPEE